MNKNITITPPHRKIDIQTIENLGIPLQREIPKGFYNMKDFIRELNLTERTISRRFSKLKKENRLETLTIMGKNDNNVNCYIKYYKILKGKK
jgi:AraC-like DNA-binding protein